MRTARIPHPDGERDEVRGCWVTVFGTRGWGPCVRLYDDDGRVEITDWNGNIVGIDRRDVASFLEAVASVGERVP